MLTRSDRPTATRRASTMRGWLVALLALSLVSCSSVPPPTLAPLGDWPSEVPVVFVPGITGSQLQRVDDDRILWGRGTNLLWPRDGGYALARPLDEGLTDEDGGSELRSPALLRSVSLAGFEKAVYGPVLELLEANGYRLGSLRQPSPGATLYPFPYDWRQDNVETARRLFQLLEGLRRARGEERLPVVLICQSNGAHVCRYLAKYGGATLDQAEAGAGPPSSLDVRKIILVGTSNGGSLRILREMDRGRTYLPGVGRKLQPETLFTFPALYQDLPRYREDLFLDAAGEPLAVDLYDAEAWERHGWSAFSPEAERRIQRSGRTDLFGDRQARRAFLERMLARAARLQAVLRRDVPGFGGSRYYLVQNAYEPTPDRAVLRRSDGRWELLFTGDRELERDSRLAALAGAPGDGHATVASQHWLAPQERAALAAEPFLIRGEHFEMILDRGTHRQLLEFLADLP